MGKMREHKLFCLSAVVLLFAVVVVFYTAIMGKYRKTTFMNSYSVKTFDEWVLEREDGTVEKIQAFPYKTDVSKGDVYTLTTVLPDDITDESGIMISINYSGTEVYVDGEKIDEYGMKQPLPFGRMIGNIRYITALNADMAGKKLTYKITCYYNGAGTLNPITYGNMDGLKLSVIYHNLWRLVISAIIFTLALLCLGFFFSMSGRKRWNIIRHFIILGHFLYTLSYGLSAALIFRSSLSMRMRPSVWYHFCPCPSWESISLHTPELSYRKEKSGSAS